MYFCWLNLNSHYIYICLSLSERTRLSGGNISFHNVLSVTPALPFNILAWYVWLAWYICIWYTEQIQLYMCHLNLIDKVNTLHSVITQKWWPTLCFSWLVLALLTQCHFYFLPLVRAWLSVRGAGAETECDILACAQLSQWPN